MTEGSEAKSVGWSRQRGKEHTSHREELIETRDEDGVKQTQEPHAERIDWHGRISNAAHRSTHFGVGRFAEESLANAFDNPWEIQHTHRSR